jgi:hypothetical protein
MPFITKSNAVSMCYRSPVLRIPIDENIFKTELWPLSKPEQQRLTSIKRILENDEILLNKTFRIRPPSIDTKTFLYEKEGGKPAYHSVYNCSVLRSNYKNYKLPVEITHSTEKNKDEIIEKFRVFTKENLEVLEENPEKFERMAQARFFLKNKTGMTEIGKENSGVVDIEEINQETLEKSIDNLLQKADEYKNKSPNHVSAIDKHGNIYPKPSLEKEQDNEILSEWHKIKSEIKTTCISYFMIKAHPDLDFKSPLLEQLGFKPCPICYKKNPVTTEDLESMCIIEK